MMGGELKVESEIGKGSSFFFTIPITLGCANELEEEGILLEEEKFTAKVLLAEDNKTTQTFMSIVLEEIARQSASVALSLMVTSILFGHNVAYWGKDEELKKKYLPKIASGEIIGAYALTEPDAGSDSVSIKTRAVRDGDYFIVNGQKMFITNAPVADVFYVFVYTDPSKKKEGMSVLLIDRNMEGVSIAKKLEKMGMRGSPTGLVFFEDVRVPVKNIIGTEGMGYPQMLKSLEIERMVISAISTGVSLAALDWMIRYANERKQFGKPIGQFEMIMKKIADAGAALDTVRTYLYMYAATYNEDKDNRFESASVKFMASETAVKITLDAIQVLGGYGYTKEYPVERYMRDAKLLDIGSGTSEIMRFVAAKSLLKAGKI
jgi:isovaleryl-CoA dehydrogenase